MPDLGSSVSPTALCYERGAAGVSDVISTSGWLGLDDLGGGPQTNSDRRKPAVTIQTRRAHSGCRYRDSAGETVQPPACQLKRCVLGFRLVVCVSLSLPSVVDAVLIGDGGALVCGGCGAG